MTDRRNEILDVAREIFAARGVKATTVREIGAQAGILSGSLYHHFTSKLDMVDAILHEFCDEILEHYAAIEREQSDPEVRLRAFADYAFSLIETQRASLIIFYSEGRHLAAQERFHYVLDLDRQVERFWRDALALGEKTGQLGHVDPTLFYRLVRDAISGAVIWYRPGKDRPISEIADAFSDLVLRGLRP